MSLVASVPVLVDEDVWPEFHDAVRSLGDRWIAPSGRVYLLALAGRRLEVDLEVSADAISPPPPAELIDADLLALAGAAYAAMGGDWAATSVAQVAQVWGGWPPGG